MDFVKQILNKKGSIMKKILALLLALTLIFALVACGGVSSSSGSGASTSGSSSSSSSSSASTESDKKSEGVMTHAEYIAAALETEVVIETYVQGMQSWWDNKATLYTQDQHGAYFLYDIACSEEDYGKLEKGTKIKVTGYKAEWAGEVEIIDGSFEILEGKFIATARDVTNLLGTDALDEHQNEFVSFKGLTVEDSGDGQAFLYNWDGSGEEGSDLYFNVSFDEEIYTFTIRRYLTDKDSQVYKDVKALKIGDKIDAEGFLYWYEGVNPHITSVTPAK